jgi:hypothetical protein
MDYTNSGGDAVWGCKAIAKVLERNERATYRILASGALNDVVQKINNQYVGSASRIRQRVFGGEAK